MVGRSNVTLQFDPLAESAYMEITDSPVAQTVQVSDAVNVDLDEFGVVVGVEVLELSAPLPDKLLKIYHFPGTTSEQVKRLWPTISRLGIDEFAETAAPASFLQPA